MVMDIQIIAPSGVMYGVRGGIFPRILRYAPLTLTTLAGLVPESLEAKISIIDEGVSSIDYDSRPDIVAISAITGTSKRSYAIADYFRDRGTAVVLGGVHPTLMPEEAMQHADSVVTGMAFETWPQLLEDFSNGKMEPIYRSSSRPNLKNLPTPRRDLLEDFSYISKGSAQATFGCPYTCDFCVVSVTSPKYIHRPIEDVIADLDSMGKFIIFMDPSPTEDRKYIIDLWREMVPLKKIWGGLATVKIGDDPEMMDLAAESGCNGLLLGFETVSQEGVDIVNKSFNTVANYETVCSSLHDRGIGINGTFIFGLDTDTGKSFDETLEFVNKVKIDLPRFAIYTPFPGTPVFEKLKSEGRILTEDWTLYDGQHVVFEPKNMSPEELREGHLRVWEETYGLKSILHRSFGASGNPLLSIGSNLGYKYYADGLREFPNDKILELEEANSPRIK